jgi:serine/threonine-protein kinase
MTEGDPVSDPKPDDEILEGETRKLSTSDVDPLAGDLDLDALTAELETRKVTAEDLEELTAVPTETDLEKGPGSKQTSSIAQIQRKAALDKARELVGRVISDRYEVEEVLAAGGMGCVYRGQHVHMHKRVAIKVLLPDTEGLPDLVLRFKREAVAGAHIDHPNVAAATDFGKLDDGSFFLVQQYVRGATLHDIIKRGPLPAQRAARIARQISAALDACHRIGIVHRDLKPRNIMVEEDRNDAVKLIDFGLARVPMDRISTVDTRDPKKNLKVTVMGTIFGTVGYMAPEAAGGMDAVDERSDLYALGIILYEMLAGVNPFGTGKPADVFRMHRSMAPPPVKERAPGATDHPGLEAIAMRLLEKNPKNRYATARDVIAALDEAEPDNDLAGDKPPVSGADRVSDRRLSGKPAEKPAEEAAKAAKAAGGDYVPRLARRPPSNKLRLDAMPRWAIPAAIAFVVVAAVVIALVFLGGDDDEKSAATEPTAAPSAAEAPTATAAPSESADREAAERAAAARKLMRAATESREWGRGAEGLATLAEVSPSSFEDRSVVNDTIAIAAGIEVGGGEKSEKVFDALTNKLGGAGLDILYEIVSTRGGSKAATRAAEILRQKEVIERASPALRIAMELRDATACKDRLALLERARTEGDTRAVAVLDNLRQLDCVAKSGECCFKTNQAVADTIKQIYARLRTPQ